MDRAGNDARALARLVRSHVDDQRARRCRRSGVVRFESLDARTRPRQQLLGSDPFHIMIVGRNGREAKLDKRAGRGALVAAESAAPDPY